MKGLKTQRTWPIAALLLVATLVWAGCGVTPTPSVKPTPFEIVSTGEYVWHEGEAFLSQSGSRTTDFKVPASKGICLGMGWGTTKGDFVEYEVPIPQDLLSAVLFIRYAREVQTDAALNVYLDGQLVGTSPSMSLSPTGGWGYEVDGWAYQELPLGPIEEGRHKVKFISQVDGGTVNIDGFFIADESFEVPRGF